MARATRLRHTAVGGLTVVLMALLGCGSSGDRPAEEETAGGELVLTGSSTVAPVASDIARRFEERNPGIRVSVQAGGSSRGIADARRGTADIGMVSRQLTEAERSKHGLRDFPMAKDGLCFIAHPENPVEGLTDEEVRAIYTGESDHWAAVGGEEEEIVVVNKAEGRATLDVFLRHYDLQTAQIDADVIIGHNEEAIKTVAGSPTAIAYVSIGAAEYHREAGTAIKILRLNGMTLTSEKLRNEGVPIHRTLNLITRGEPESLARRFIDFAQSKKVHGIIEDHYFVPTGP